MWQNLKIGKGTTNTLQYLLKSKNSTSIVLEGYQDILEEVALEYARAVNCMVNDAEPCDQCVACKTALSFNNPDIMHIRIMENKKGICVEQIRELHKETCIKPFREEFKVIIIHDADTMNIASQNAILKLLEEPPDYVRFILLVKDSGKLLQTIQSRCIKINTYLMTGEEAKKHNVSSYLNPESKLLNDEIVEIIKHYPNKSTISILKDAEMIVNKYDDRLSEVVCCISLYLRDVLMEKLGSTESIINTNAQAFIITSPFRIGKIYELLEAASKTKYSLEIGCSKKIVINALLLKIGF